MSHMAVCEESRRANRTRRFVPGENSDAQRHEGLEHGERGVARASGWLFVFPKSANGVENESVGSFARRVAWYLKEASPLDAPFCCIVREYRCRRRPLGIALFHRAGH